MTIQELKIAKKLYQEYERKLYVERMAKIIDGWKVKK